MCGILLYHQTKGLDESVVQDCLCSLKSIEHRGPDGEGVWLFNTSTRKSTFYSTEDTPSALRSENNINVADYDLLLGHRRLSIIDISTSGHQPMSAFGSCIIFNGEVYNYIELRKELESEGFSFRSDSDTEVVLAAYRAWGEDCFARFNGMWAMCIVDVENNKLVISRDRFGVKPLYRLQVEGTTVFASELKQFNHFRKVRLEPEIESVNAYLEFGLLDYDEHTLLQNVVSIRPATCLTTCNFKDFISNRFYELSESDPFSGSFDDACEQFHSLLSEAVRVRLRTDVPWGVGLSGGLDSSSIVYLANKIIKDDSSNPLRVFSAVFPGFDSNEEEFIDQIIEDLGITGFKTVPTDSFDINSVAREIYMQDVPIRSTSFFAQGSVARLAKENGVKVLLVGQGGDETLAGYHHHFYRFLRNKWLKGKWMTYRDEMMAYSDLKGKRISELKQIIRAELKLYLRTSLGMRKSGNKWEDKRHEGGSLRKLLNLDMERFLLPFFLHSDDRTGMSHSIESRHPFLDYRLVDFAQSLPDEFLIHKGWQKRIIRESITDMPDAIRYRADKKGFATPQKTMESSLGDEFNKYKQVCGREYGMGPNGWRNFAVGVWHSIQFEKEFDLW